MCCVCAKGKWQAPPVALEREAEQQQTVKGGSIKNSTVVYSVCCVPASPSRRNAHHCARSIAQSAEPRCAAPTRAAPARIGSSPRAACQRIALCGGVAAWPLRFPTRLRRS
eukprot:6186585-Pleurochrysis_carterae.AAC.3